MAKKKPDMEKVFLNTFGWAFGLIFIFAGLSFASSEFFFGGLMFTTGVLMIPHFYTVMEKFNIKVPKAVIACAIVFLIIMMFITLATTDTSIESPDSILDFDNDPEMNFAQKLDAAYNTASRLCDDFVKESNSLITFCEDRAYAIGNIGVIADNVKGLDCTKFNKSNYEGLKNSIIAFDTNLKIFVKYRKGCSNSPKVLNEDLYGILYKFTNQQSPMTELQKKEEWKKYKGRYVRSSALVDSVDESLFGSYVVLASELPKGPYDIGSDYAIFFKDSQKGKLMKLSKGQRIHFLGKLERYHDFMKNLDINEAIVISE